MKFLKNLTIGGLSVFFFTFAIQTTLEGSMPISTKERPSMIQCLDGGVVIAYGAVCITGETNCAANSCPD